jgi:cysteinyl-tRNA synthetase
MNRTINAPEFRLSVGAVSSLQAALAAHQRMVDVLQIFVDAGQEAAESITPRLLDLLVSLRTEARSRKEFATGDRIRNALKEMGVILEDHRDGTSWRIAND